MKIKCQHGTIENVKIMVEEAKDKKIKKCFIVLNGEEIDSREMLMMNYEIVEIDRLELVAFNKFMLATKIHLWETSDFFDGKIQGWIERDSENNGNDKI